MMKVVFVAELGHTSASGRQRIWALQQCGVEVFSIDKHKYPSVFGKWGGRIAKLLLQPTLRLNSAKLGAEIIRLCKQVEPDLIWFEWAREIKLPVLKELRRLKSKPVLISFQDDNPWGERTEDKWMWKNYFDLVPEFDLHLIKRESDKENLEKLGARKSKIWMHGIYKPFFFPPTSPKEKKYPVSFVGTCFDKRVQLIEYLLENGIPIHIFGTHWQQRSDLPRRYPNNFHPEVMGEAYADVIRNSQICLGLVSESNKDEWTMRTFEVPGCAGLLLAERTEMHSKLFDEGKDGELFSGPEECLNKLRDLLPNPEKCMLMGNNAFNKFINNHWTIEAFMREQLKEIGCLLVC